MRGLLVPIILFAAAIGLFAMYTNPTYQTTKALAAERAQYDAALNTSKELRTQRDQLLAKRSTFAKDDVDKLKRLLPDNVDNIRLIIDVNNIAARHQLTLKNVQLGEIGGSNQRGGATSVGSSGGAIGSVELGFTVSASFENFNAFMLDLEHSLRLVDIEKVSFKNGAGASTDFTVTIQTYWLH